MGLTSWVSARYAKATSPCRRTTLSSVEIDELNRLTTMFLDFAEDRTRRRRQIRMAEWAEATDRFLDFNERHVLGHAGSVSPDDMAKLAHERIEAEARRLADQGEAP